MDRFSVRLYNMLNKAESYEEFAEYWANLNVVPVKYVLSEYTEAEELVGEIVGTVQDFTIFSNDEGKLPEMADDFTKGTRMTLNFQYNAENGRTRYRKPWVNPLQTDVSILTAKECEILGL